MQAWTPKISRKVDSTLPPRRTRKLFIFKLSLRKKLFGKKNLSKDLSEISAGDSQKKLKTSVREISLAREETSSPPDASNKIKLPFFMIPLKGVQVITHTEPR